jgi:hypothetical protein
MKLEESLGAPVRRSVLEQLMPALPRAENRPVEARAGLRLSPAG